jgi:hypothetical protein
MVASGCVRCGLYVDGAAAELRPVVVRLELHVLNGVEDRLDGVSVAEGLDVEHVVEIEEVAAVGLAVERRDGDGPIEVM